MSEADPRDGALVTPPWHLDEPVETRGRGLGGTLRPVLRLVREAAPGAAVLVAVLQLGSGLASTFGLLSTANVLTKLFTGGPTADRVVAALPALLFVAGAYAARGALEVAAGLAQARITPTVRRLAEERLFAASLRAPLAAFDDDDFHDRLHRAKDRGLFYLGQATQKLVELTGSLVGMVAAAVALAVLHPLLVPLLLVAVLPDAWAVHRAARLRHRKLTELVAHDRRVQLVADLATGRVCAAEIRACQAEPFVLHEYRLAADPLRHTEIRLGIAEARLRGVGRTLAGVGIAVTYVTVGVLANAGWIALATAGTAVLAIRTATAALARVVAAANELVEQGLYIADFEAFLTAAPPSAPPRPADRGVHPGRIRLDGVSFRYPGSDRPALRDVTLAVNHGETVALVGENGSGKTTLAKVLAGLYRPAAGTVTWDGTDLDRLDRAAVADRVMMVFQQPIRWPHTARANVRAGRHDRPDPGDELLRAAAEQAGADRVVDRLSDGWHTLLSAEFRGGRDLSGGQWQRLAVARGLFRDAPLLIWDEPTAPLDPEGELAVYESLRTMSRDRTVVLITHRLASVRHVDRIYLLHDGEIAEHGTHDELVALGGRYARLLNLQTSMYAR